MIIKIGKSGHSFKGLAEYLTHDPEKAQTSQRVAWTHTQNLANDFVPAAVNEMVWTSRDAELLKQEAGVHAGGRKNERPVKPISMSWDPRDNPSDRHMLKSAQDFLRSMGWHEHQAIFVAHNDKSFKHVHIMLNEIHPETGRTLDDGWEKNRAQKWGDAYERENGFRCPQRAQHQRGREKSMPRNIHMMFENSAMEFEKSEQQLRKSELAPEYRKNDEWEIFKEIQRNQRDQFYAEGKIKFKKLRQEVYYTVHQKFRERWSDYYKADKKTVGDDRRFLTQVKSQLVTDEKAALTVQRDEAFAHLLKERKKEKEIFLAGQRADRAEFRDRLKFGQDNADFFRRISDKGSGERDLRAKFAAAKRETTSRVLRAATTAKEDVAPIVRKAARPKARGRDIASRGLAKAGRGLGSLFDALFTGLTNLGSAVPEPKTDVRNTFDSAAEEATKQYQREQTQKIDDEERSRQRHVYRE